MVGIKKIKRINLINWRHKSQQKSKILSHDTQNTERVHTDVPMSIDMNYMKMYMT